MTDGPGEALFRADMSPPMTPPGMPTFNSGMRQGRLSLPSSEPILSPEIASAFAQSKADDMAATMARSAMVTGEIERTFGRILSDLRAVRIGAPVISGMPAPTPTTQKAPEGVPYGPQEAPGSVRTGSGTGAPSGAAPGPTGPVWDPSAQGKQPTPLSQMDYQQGKQVGSSMTSVAQQVSSRAAQFVSERTPNVEQLADGSLQQYAADGSVVGAPVTPEDPSYAGLLRSSSRGAAVAGSLSKFASTGKISGALGSVSRFAGPVGLGVGAVVGVGNFLEGQNDAAAQYRRAYGGEDTGMFAAEDRFGGMMAGLSGFGTTGYGRTQDMYEQASALGYRDDTRDKAVDFASDMYLKYGMETSESMKLVDQQVRQGNENLTSLAEALEAVGEAAVEGGKSAAEAQELFAQQVTQIATNVTADPEAQVATVEAINTMTSELPIELRTDAAGNDLDYGTVLSGSNLNRVAAATGQDMASLRRQIQSGRGINRTFNQIMDQVAEVAANANGTTVEAIQQHIEDAYGEDWEATDEDIAQVMEVLELDPRLISMAFLRYGIPGDETMNVQQFFEIISGGMHLTTAREVGKVKNTIGGLFGGILPGLSNGSSTPNYQTDKDRKEAASDDDFGGVGESSTTTEQEISERLGYADEGSIVSPSAGGDMGAPEVLSAYTGLVDSQGGEGSEAIEALLNSDNSEEVLEAGDVSNLDDVRLQVRDADGNAVEVSLSEAISNADYRKQIEDGTASILGEEGETPTSISDITGIRGASESSSSSGGGGSSPGEFITDLVERANREMKGAARRTEVEIRLGPRARELLDIRVRGNGPTDSQRRGVPPSGRRVTSDQRRSARGRPTGGGD